MNIAETYTDLNAREWDKRAREGNVWTLPIDHDEFVRARAGDWRVLLTPIKPVPAEWFPPFSRTTADGTVPAKILGLASGGGQQCPIFAALGAEVTVFDISAKQLETELIMAGRESYDINLVKGDMTKPFPFADALFDLVFHPVSNCYIHDVHHVWQECHRVLKPGGTLLAGFNNPDIYLFGTDAGRPLHVANKLPYDPLRDGNQAELERLARESAIEFSHSLTSQIGGQLKAGFILQDLYEDTDREDPLAQYMPCYIATRSLRPPNP